MKILLTIYIVFGASFLFAQDTIKTPWIFVADYPRNSSDTAYWLVGKILPTSDSTGVQHRKSATGVIQRREFYYKRKD